MRFPKNLMYSSSFIERLNVIAEGYPWVELSFPDFFFKIRFKLLKIRPILIGFVTDCWAFFTKAFQLIYQSTLLLERYLFWKGQAVWKDSIIIFVSLLAWILIPLTEWLLFNAHKLIMLTTTESLNRSQFVCLIFVNNLSWICPKCSIVKDAESKVSLMPVFNKVGYIRWNLSEVNDFFSFPCQPKLD